MIFFIRSQNIVHDLSPGSRQDNDTAIKHLYQKGLEDVIPHVIKKKDPQKQHSQMAE